MRNKNHPKKGSVLKIEPIRTLKDINKIRSILRHNSRDSLIFNFGINTNLRAVDLVNLKISDVKYVEVGETLILKESKSGKVKSISINKVCHRFIQKHLRSNNMRQASDEDYLFQSRKGKKKLHPNTLNGLVKIWTSKAKIEGNFGSHTLRKTFGYIHRTYWETDIPTLMKLFNHSTQEQTLRYLCVQPKEIKQAYMRQI